LSNTKEKKLPKTNTICREQPRATKFMVSKYKFNPQKYTTPIKKNPVQRKRQYIIGQGLSKRYLLLVWVSAL